jgi:hypothetical protein
MRPDRGLILRDAAKTPLLEDEGIDLSRDAVALERFRAKWAPVLVRKTRQNNKLETSVPIQSGRKRL